MPHTFKDLAHRSGVLARRLLTTITDKPWTVAVFFVAIGLFFALLVPAMGLAVWGTAVSIGAYVAAGLVGLFGIVGHWLGLGVQNRALKKKLAEAAKK